MKRYSITRIEPHLDVMAAYGVAGYQVAGMPESVIPTKFALIVQREGAFNDPELPEDVRAFDRLVQQFDAAQHRTQSAPPPLTNEIVKRWLEFCQFYSKGFYNAEQRLNLCEEYSEILRQLQIDFERAANTARAGVKPDPGMKAALDVAELESRDSDVSPR